MNFYNENNPRAAAVLRILIADGRIPPGVVDERSITEITPDELKQYTQCHFFAGIGGWSYALELAGWPPTRSIWTGSCPCQPWSDAGFGLGIEDTRHLWPVWNSLIQKSRPQHVLGEQVASKAAFGWLDGVFGDLESQGYACAAANLCAAGVGAPHARQRLFWAANSAIDGCKGIQRGLDAQVPTHGSPQALDAWHGLGSPFEHWAQLLAKPHVERVADGISSGMDIRPRLHAYGNAIVPEVGEAFIRSYIEAIDFLAA